MTKHYKILELKELVEKESPKISFEFFPPKTAELEASLWDTVKDLEKLNPEFVSVTYGAGGSTREKTHKIISKIKAETNLNPAAHLTCVKADKAEINDIAQGYWDMGVKHIVALRGDPPDMNGDYVPHPGGYQYAADLVAGLKELADFEISVAAYPEGHPHATSFEDDLMHLKDKLDAGADRAITQYFFDTDDYLRFLDKADKIGITKPIVPGLLPIGNFKQAVSFSARCGASVPKWLHKLYDGIEDGSAPAASLSALVMAEQCSALVAAGVPQIHFYTLNKADMIKSACAVIGVK